MHGLWGTRMVLDVRYRRPTGDWRRDIHLFWLDDTPQQARFLSPEEKNALIRQLASEEEKKVTSRLADALRNGRVWQLAIIYLTIQVAVYGLIFFLPTRVAALLGTKVGFTASVVTAVPWWRLCLAHGLFLATPTVPAIAVTLRQ